MKNLSSYADFYLNPKPGPIIEFNVGAIKNKGIYILFTERKYKPSGEYKLAADGSTIENAPSRGTTLPTEKNSQDSLYTGTRLHPSLSPSRNLNLMKGLQCLTEQYKNHFPNDNTPLITYHYFKDHQKEHIRRYKAI